ncbi:MAG: amino acid adenylation domain-containing protein [Acidimicrobiia bacterium]|nr:amino acid adenylation domain-containing protein [Acidimicrobiia bacterium]
MHRYLLSSLVPEAASDRPSAPAVVCGDDQLTWEEFETRTARLAGTLLAHGVRRSDRVGIYVHKSIESMVAVHGILRAGAAYVPIDPLAPIDLIESIIADCGIEILVTHQLRKSGLAKLLPKLGPTTVIGVDGDQFELGASAPGSASATGRAGSIRFVTWAEVDATDPIPPARLVADDLAYVMYTSGSTGRPKGMMHTHGSGLAYALMAADVYGLGPDDRPANFSPLHFDMSTFEVFAGVSAGATAVLVPEPHLRLPASLTDYLSAHRVTTLYTVPSLLIQMMTRGALDQRDWSSLRWIMPAGEVFPPEPLQQLRAMVPDSVVFSNVYGPAEVNQITHHHLAADFEGTMPIGHASPGAEVALIDEDDNTLEGPATGELIARTATMMAGYWNRPDLDEKGFLYRDGPGGLRQRWYRTGDLCRRDETGLLHYLGRRDNQVKVRGYRVELEVVEAAVGSLPGVEQAVVGVRPGSDGDSTLIARFIPAGVTDDADADTAGSTGEWRAALSATLPSYAIPAGFEPVETFPLTPSGKIDRRAVRRALAHRPDDRSGRGLEA